ncbi:photosynthetic NDH subunit of subcomplex B 1, chloroplastic [Dorcoceras hygrometricum]|uniref:Photosynthetic NDH subunit of subcomplex B 1, chloroplastic n=1 Tax=Dorcoceras hygrometricum TaxID=472368 RepID=A0A2Z7CR34_9LAMI|nr:photosynthetic NDH subunit of subcomplex B 1, chloroplastic [Dorcoceras hygrometricum]
MLLSRSADIVLSLQRVFAKKCKRQRFDKLERRRGVHCYESADDFDKPADALLGVYQQLYFKIAKRRHLIKLTRHRFIAKGISRWKNAYAFQQMNSSKRFSSRSSQRRWIGAEITVYYFGSNSNGIYFLWRVIVTVAIEDYKYQQR